ncbi:MAG: TIM barrel protein [Clostridia bacterium]|nr:TIM barrel protein [Clostridia bacterium]
MSKVLFGPSGNSESFYAEGHKGTIETPKWLKDKKLDLFEYSFGRGYTMKTDMAQKLGEEFKKYGIELSLHAPYFINFANPDEEMFQKTIGYIKTGIKFMHSFGAKRLIFHPASCGKAKREDAVALMNERIASLMPEFVADMTEDMFLCPETMGKTMQIGTYKEIIDLCTVSEKLMPTFDFGHINALTQGTLKTKEDYQRIFDYSFDKLGEWRTKNAHIHFSKIEYGSKGEIRHLTFEDKIYGPEFEPLCECLIENGMNCHIICESNGTMAEDSVAMKNTYLSMQ